MSWRARTANLIEAFEKPFPIMNRIDVDGIRTPFLGYVPFSFSSTKAYIQAIRRSGVRVLRTHKTIPKKKDRKRSTADHRSEPVVLSIHCCNQLTVPGRLVLPTYTSVGVRFGFWQESIDCRKA